MSSISLILNSKYRDSGSISNPTFVLDDNINDIESYKVRSFMIPLSSNTIDERNNKIHFKEGTGGSLKTATLQSGNFNGITFATNLKNSLNSVGSTIFDVVYSTTANKIVINNGTGGVFSFTQGSNSGLYEAGLENQYGSFATSFTSANLDLSGLKIINIASNFGGLTINSRSNSRLLASIITEEASLAVSSHIDESNDYISSNVNQLSSINLSFQDDQFRSLTLDKDYQLELLLKRKQDE